jgi:hypothetical protein|tara:strand:+ start:123 stop:332 length:210 start_codon:yes stop_codon:yes gene_type:complete
MAKTGRRHVTGQIITTKSWFGSHAEMIVEELEDGRIICEDDSGKYYTTRDRIDSGLADTNRQNTKNRIN